MIWQTIETAPRDGTTFIGWHRFLTEPVTCKWENNRFISCWESEQVIEYQDDRGTDYKDVGPLTHWQPLPEIPNEE